MAKSVELNSIRFATHKAAIDYCRSILYSYEVGHAVSNPLHDQILRELADRHPDAEEKAGAGILEFFINETRAGDYSHVSADARGIWIRRVDNSVVDWSYQTAIRRPGPKVNFKDALRLAVDSERLVLRDTAFAAGSTVVCAITQMPILRKGDADVIYRDPSWDDLVERFVGTLGGWSKVETSSGGGGVAVGARLTDPAVLASWLSYWKANARPILVMKDEGGRGPRP